MNVVICLYNNFFLYILCIPSLFLHYSSTHVQVYGSIGHAMLPQLASAQGTGNRCRLTNGLIASSHLDILSPPLHGLIMIAAVENLRISKLAIQATDWKLSCNSYAAANCMWLGHVRAQYIVVSDTAGWWFTGYGALITWNGNFELESTDVTWTCTCNCSLLLHSHTARPAWSITKSSVYCRHGPSRIGVSWCSPRTTSALGRPAEFCNLANVIQIFITRFIR